MRIPAYSHAAACLFLFLCPAWGQERPPQDAGQQVPASNRYLRVQRNSDGEPVTLDTSIITFRSRDASGPRLDVDLIGAVHVADAAYYQRLNERFAQYDALLYELVAPEGANVPTGGQSSHPVGAMQRGLKSILNLAFQLECIDYTKQNFVHADMSPAEFSRVMAERGESFLQMMLRMMGQAMARQAVDSGTDDARLLLALFSSDRPLRLKRIMAEQFEDLEGSMQAIEGPNGSTLISQRNKKAIEVLKQELDSDKSRRRIGIFYGAGHMPDMARRLEQEFDLQPVGEQWLTAWDMH